LFKFIQRGEIKCHIYLGDLRGFSLPQHDADDVDGNDGRVNTTINWLKDWRRDGGGNEDGNGMSLPTSILAVLGVEGEGSRSHAMGGGG
jgi:hypothetical protein